MLFGAAIGAIALIACATRGNAQTVVSWIGASGTGGAGNWSTAADWSGGVVPNNATPTYDVLIDNGLSANSAVTLDTPNTICDLTIDSGDSLTIANDQVLTVVGNGTTGTITVNGALNLSSSSNYTDLVISAATVTLAGAGTVTLSNGPYDRIYAASGSDVFVNQATIQGLGEIGNNSLTFSNSGTVDANQPTALNIDPSGGTTNTGTMEATSGGTLIFSGHSVNNAGGTILAANGSTIDLNAVTITGGILSSTGTGVLMNAAGTVLNGVTLSSGSVLELPNSQYLTASGTFTNYGSVTLNSTANYTDLAVAAGGLTLTGGGAITLESSGPYGRILGATGSAILTNVDNTISGEGYIGAGLLQLDNQSLGVIDANVPGATLLFQPNSAGFSNTGTLEATGGGTLEFASGQYANAGGLVNVASTALFSGATLTGGTIDVGSSGVLQLTGGASLTGETLNASNGAALQNLSGTNTLGGSVNLAVGSTLAVANNTALELPSSGAYSNSGTVTLNSTANYTQLIMTGGTVTLSGGGTVSLSDSPYNLIYGLAGTETLANANNLIEGSGSIGYPGHGLTLNNQGTVDADQLNPLTIEPSGGTTNSGTMEATAGATLLFSGYTLNNAGGTVNAASNSTVELLGTAATGGTVTIAGTGTLELSSNASLTGETVNTVSGSSVQNVSGTNTLGGNVNLAAGSSLAVLNNTALELPSSGVYSNSGAITLNSTANYTQLIMTGGTVTLSGGGTVSLSASPYNLIYGLAGTETLVNANNLIEGSGSIGYPGHGLTFNNQGTVNANQSVPLTIEPSGGTTNTGTMEATAGATLLFSGYSVNNAGGTIAAANGSAVSLYSVAITGGTLSSAGTGVITTANNSILNGILLAAGSALQIPNSFADTFSGTFANSGTVSLGSTANYTDFIVSAGGLTLTGGGLISLTDSPYNRIYGPTLSTPLDNVNDTISGAGQIGNGTLTLTNTGTLVATGTNPLVLNVASPFTNQGSLVATGTGGMQFAVGNLTNSATVAVQSGSTLSVLAGQYIQTGGATSLTSGTLNASGVSIQSGIFSGSGSVGSAVSNSGLLHPVQSLALTGNLTLTGSSTILFDLGGSAPVTGYDTLSASSVVLGGSLDLIFTSGYQSTILPSTTFTLITASGGLSGQFAGVVNGSVLNTTDGLGAFTVSYLPTSLTISNFTPVPEPPAAALLGMGAALLLAARLARPRLRLTPSR